MIINTRRAFVFLAVQRVLCGGCSFATRLSLSVTWEVYAGPDEAQLILVGNPIRGAAYRP